MAGLVPAIPITKARQCPPKRDARDKRGHDASASFPGRSAVRRAHQCSNSKSIAFAVLAAMAAAVFLGKALCFGLRAVLLGDLAALPHDHIAALGHAEWFRQLAKVIELGVGRMLERLEPSRMDEVRHRYAIDIESVFLGRVAHFISVFRAVGGLRP